MNQPLEEEVGCIVGAVVQLSSNNTNICQQLKEIEGVEIHAEDEQLRLVITMEAETSRKVMELTEYIQNLDGVLQITPVYQHNEENLKHEQHGGWKWR